MKKIVALVLSLVMVLGLATTAMAATTTAAVYDLHQADAKGTEIAGDVAYTLNDAVVLGDGSGATAYYTIEGKYYVEIDKADATVADFYVTKANEKTALFYLTEVAAGENYYEYVAVEFKNIGVKCDQLSVPYAYTAAGLDFFVYTHPVTGIKTYFVEKDADFTGYLTTASAAYYNGGSEGTATRIMVDNELVDVYPIEAATAAGVLNQHVWAPVAYDKTVPTEALCGLCGAKAVVYEEDEAPAGSVVIPVTFGTADYELVITATASTPVVDGEKVESAETFDAGIAMYVGMSVMAAAGSAVVLKKKD